MLLCVDGIGHVMNYWNIAVEPKDALPTSLTLLSVWILLIETAGCYL